MVEIESYYEKNSFSRGYKEKVSKNIGNSMQIIKGRGNYPLL